MFAPQAGSNPAADRQKICLERARRCGALSFCGISRSLQRIAARDHRQDIPPPRAIPNFRLFFDDRHRLHMAAQQARYGRGKTRAMVCDFPSGARCQPTQPSLESLRCRLRAAARPHKFIVTAVARQRKTTVNALVKAGPKRLSQTPMKNSVAKHPHEAIKQMF